MRIGWLASAEVGNFRWIFAVLRHIFHEIPSKLNIAIGERDRMRVFREQRALAGMIGVASKCVGAGFVASAVVREGARKFEHSIDRFDGTDSPFPH
jgi:hypothetical protein